MDFFATDSHSFFDISWSQLLVQPDHEFSQMLKSDHVFGLGSARVHDLCAAADLERRILLQHLLVSLNIPLRRHGQSSV